MKNPVLQPTDVVGPPTDVVGPPTDVVGPPTDVVGPPTDVVSPHGASSKEKANLTWKLTVFKTKRPFIPALPNWVFWLFHVKTETT